MAPKADNSGSPKATDQEARFFLAVFRNMKGQIQVDWNSVAKEAGYNNGGSAHTRFAQIKRRLGINNNGKGGTAAANLRTRVTKRTAKTPAGKAAKRTKISQDDTWSGSEDDEGFPMAKKEVKSEEEEMKLKDEEVKLEIKDELDEI